VLHDKRRDPLLKAWFNWSAMPWQQPVHQIRSYFVRVPSHMCGRPFCCCPAVDCGHTRRAIRAAHVVIRFGSELPLVLDTFSSCPLDARARKLPCTLHFSVRWPRHLHLHVHLHPHASKSLPPILLNRCNRCLGRSVHHVVDLPCPSRHSHVFPSNRGEQSGCRVAAHLCHSNHSVGLVLLRVLEARTSRPVYAVGHFRCDTLMYAWFARLALSVGWLTDAVRVECELCALSLSPIAGCRHRRLLESSLRRGPQTTARQKRCALSM
jgi:hypothetical protein